MTWEEVIADPSLHDLPYKIELNEHGRILMSPVLVSHSGYQGEIIRLLNLSLPHGTAVPECATQTTKNVKVPDVAWFTPKHWEVARREKACSTAPEICVEVASESNTDAEFNEKRALYFEAGAQEVWFCDLMGNISFFDSAGPRERSAMCPEFPTEV